MSRKMGEGVVCRTRKEHDCEVCRKVIQKGDPANWQTNTGLSGNDFGTVYWHVDCNPDPIRTFDGCVPRQGRTGLMGTKTVDVKYILNLEERVKRLEQACLPPARRKKTVGQDPSQLSILDIKTNLEKAEV